MSLTHCHSNLLCFLQSLHSLNIMHRDIRWDNVLKKIDKDIWFIIDFDDACFSPSRIPNKKLAYESHAPEIFTGFHDTSVDIWSVGYLISRAPVKNRLLSKYAREMMVEDYRKRPTAVGSLQWLGRKFTKILSDNELVWQNVTCI